MFCAPVYLHEEGINFNGMNALMISISEKNILLHELNFILKSRKTMSCTKGDNVRSNKF